MPFSSSDSLTLATSVCFEEGSEYDKLVTSSSFKFVNKIFEIQEVWHLWVPITATKMLNFPLLIILK